jgi:hypothetical protein
MRPASLLPLVILLGGARAQEPVGMSACATAQSLPPSHATLEAYVQPIRPRLNFAFRFQGGYSLELPLQQFEGATNVIRVLSRVVPVDGSGEPVCLLQTAELPKVPVGLTTSLSLSEGFFLGEGTYQIDVTVTDQSERVYRKSLTLKAAPKRRSRGLKLALRPGVVQPTGLLVWKPRQGRETSSRSRLTVLFHAASLYGSRTSLGTFDQVLLLSSLSTVLSEARFDEIRLIAFNLDQQRELFRQDHLGPDGFRRLMETVLSLKLMWVPIAALKPRSEGLALLESLVRDEMSAREPADAILFLGPDVVDDWKWKSLPCESKGSGPPLFYFQHRIDKAPEMMIFGGATSVGMPIRPTEFPDTLERMVHACSGHVYRIHNPAELATAIRQLNDRAQAAHTARGH